MSAAQFSTLQLVFAGWVSPRQCEVVEYLQVETIIAPRGGEITESVSELGPVVRKPISVASMAIAESAVDSPRKRTIVATPEPGPAPATLAHDYTFTAVSGGDLRFEAKLWQVSRALRSNETAWASTR